MEKYGGVRCMSDRERVCYDGDVVGHLRTEHGVKIFEWSQSPFRYFSKEDTVAYGMSVGLASYLEEKEVHNIEVDKYTFSLRDVFQSDTVDPDHHVFNHPPDEAQYLIRVSRHKNQ